MPKMYAHPEPLVPSQWPLSRLHRLGGRTASWCSCQCVRQARAACMGPCVHVFRPPSQTGMAERVEHERLQLGFLILGLLPQDSRAFRNGLLVLFFEAGRFDVATFRWSRKHPIGCGGIPPHF